jgi:transcriptional regulator with XRE-family HTH domain
MTAAQKRSRSTKNTPGVKQRRIASDSSVIGARIRDRRKALDLNLKQLAEKTGFTSSFISLVERDKTSLSIESLIKIAEALDVPFFHFTRTNANTTTPVVRAGERVKLTFPRIDLVSELLVPDLRGRLEVFVSRGRPNTGNIARIPAHDSEEVIFVMKGSLRVQLHELNYDLAEGDSIYFHLSALRAIYVQGEHEAMWLTVITPPVL